MGRVWSSGCSAWVSDLTREPEGAIDRAALAIRSGLRCEFCVPVIASELGPILGVMTFLSREPLPCDEALLQAMTTLGRQIGLFAERRRTQAELTQVNARLNAVLDASTQVSIIATDPEGLITVFNPGAERMLGYSAREMVGKTPLRAPRPGGGRGARGATVGRVRHQDRGIRHLRRAGAAGRARCPRVDLHPQGRHAADRPARGDGRGRSRGPDQRLPRNRDGPDRAATRRAKAAIQRGPVPPPGRVQHLRRRLRRHRRQHHRRQRRVPGDGRLYPDGDDRGTTPLGRADPRLLRGSAPAVPGRAEAPRDVALPSSWNAAARMARDCRSSWASPCSTRPGPRSLAHRSWPSASTSRNESGWRTSFARTPASWPRPTPARTSSWRCSATSCAIPWPRSATPSRS